MAYFKPRVQSGQILAGTLTKTFNLTPGGGELPENIKVILKFSAMSGSETLDITGRYPGCATYETAVLTTQIDVKAAESTVTVTDLSAKKGVQYLLFTAANIAAAETIDIVVLSW